MTIAEIQEAIAPELDRPWVKQWQGTDEAMKEFIGRQGLEPFRYVDCLVTPSGSRVLGWVRVRKESDDVYRMIYVVEYPSGGVHLGEGLAMFAEEPQKYEQRYGLGRLGFTKIGVDG